jgi:hypothetical protein
MCHSNCDSVNPPRDEINQSTINTLNRAGEPNISRNEADIYVNSPHASIHTENQASHSPTTSRITMPVTGTSTNLMHKRSNMVETSSHDDESDDGTLKVDPPKPKRQKLRR